MEKVDILIKKLQSQIEAMDEKVAGLICELREIDSSTKESCLKKANELNGKILEMQEQIENLKKNIKVWE